MDRNVKTKLVFSRESGEMLLREINEAKPTEALRHLLCEIDRQVADGIAAEERGELHVGEEAMAEIRAELEARRSGG